MGASKSKGLDRIATVGYGYIYTREMNLGLLNNLAFPSFDYWRLRRRLKCEKLTDDDGHKVMTIVHLTFGSGVRTNKD